MTLFKLPTWLIRAFTLPKDKNSLEDLFGAQIGSLIRALLPSMLKQQVDTLVKANYSDPETLAKKLASDVNAAADPLYKAVKVLADKIGKGYGDVVVSFAKEKIYDELKDLVAEKVGDKDQLSQSIYDIIAKATKL